MENCRTEADILGWFREGVARIKKGSNGIADRIPVYAQMSHHSAKLAGESTREFFTNAEVFLRSELAADLFYGIDSPTIHYDVYNIESEAVGAKLIWSENQIPAIDSRCPLLSSLDALERLRPIKIGAAGRMPYVLEMNARLRDMGLAPKVRFTGLFTLAANLLGLQELILAILAEPDRVHRLMKFLTCEIVAPWIVCQRTHCGSQETATGSDALASPPLISTETIREFCLKYIKELEQQVGGVRLAGLWGESVLHKPAELLDIKKAGSPGAIQVLDPDVTSLGPAFFRKYADEARVGLVMGLDANLIASGSFAEIESRARRFIEEAGKTGRFVLFINDIPYDTPPQNVHAAIAVAHEYCADSSNTCYVRKQHAPVGQPVKTIKEACRLISGLMNREPGRQK